MQGFLQPAAPSAQPAASGAPAARAAPAAPAAGSAPAAPAPLPTAGTARAKKQTLRSQRTEMDNYNLNRIRRWVPATFIPSSFCWAPAGLHFRGLLYWAAGVRCMLCRAQHAGAPQGKLAPTVPLPRRCFLRLSVHAA